MCDGVLEQWECNTLPDFRYNQAEVMLKRMEVSENWSDVVFSVFLDDNSSTKDEKAYTLAVCFKYGAIYFMNNYDDVCPRVIQSTLTGICVCSCVFVSGVPLLMTLLVTINWRDFHEKVVGSSCGAQKGSHCLWPKQYNSSA